MALEIFGSLTSLICNLSGSAIDHTLLRITILLLLLWTAWRLWRFNISPFLHPNEPKELPYWIPFIGHGFAFFKSTDALLAKASAYFRTREPFSLTVFGNTLYIVTDAKNTTEVYKNDETLSFETFVQDLFRSNGYSEAGLRKTYTSLPKDKPGFPNPHGVSFGAFVQQMHQHQLYPGGHLQILEDNFRNWLNANLSITPLQKLCSHFATSSAGDSVVVPLDQCCSEISLRAGEFAYFGNTLSRINPDLTSDFLVFDDLGWQVLYQYPPILSRKMAAARKRIQSTFRRYLEVPQSERTAGGAVWLINAYEDEAKAIGISDDDLAILLFNIYWVISTNTRKIAFWLLSNALHAPPLLERIRDETAPAFNSADLVDLDYLWQHCPQLDSIWHETLRLCSNAASVRRVDHDTVVGGKLLRAGHRIMIPYRLLHFDQAVYGFDSRKFRPDRWLATPSTTMTTKQQSKQGDSKTLALKCGPSWRPFGGGKTLCTGRHAAKRATLMLVAVLLRRFDVQMLGDPTAAAPEADLGRPVLGISSVKEGQDFEVKLRAYGEASSRGSS
ncbi:putative cytochrome p450 [Xylaria venustula]|nr:putative cytochrome p450 [Xylaria venustula]